MTILTLPSKIESLADHLFIKTRVRTYGGTRTNREKAQADSKAAGAKVNFYAVGEFLFPGDPGLHNISKYRQTIDNWLRREAHMWGPSMWIVPGFEAPAFLDTWHNEHVPAFKARVDEWIGTDDLYEDRIAAAAFKLQGAFNRAHYPSRAEIYGSFGIDLFILDPPRGDFRCAVSTEQAQNLQAHFEQQTNTLLQELYDDQVEELIDFITRIRDGMGQTVEVGDDGKTKITNKRIHESTLERARLVTDRYSKFNITQDPRLDEAVKALRVTLNKCHDTKALRKEQSLRTEVRDDMDSILSKFGL